MKLILLAAAAIIATPAIAQQSGSTGTSSPTSDGARGDATNMPAPAPATQTPPADAPMAAPMPAPMAGQMPMATPDAAAAATAGGYQPAMPALRGTPAPGAPVVFQPAPTPTEAFPPPAPMAKYPICKKGQYDGCMQRGGK